MRVGKRAARGPEEQPQKVCTLLNIREEGQVKGNNIIILKRCPAGNALMLLYLTGLDMP